MRCQPNSLLLSRFRHASVFRLSAALLALNFGSLLQHLYFACRTLRLQFLSSLADCLVDSHSFQREPVHLMRQCELRTDEKLNPRIWHFMITRYSRRYDYMILLGSNNKNLLVLFKHAFPQKLSLSTMNIVVLTHARPQPRYVDLTKQSRSKLGSRQCPLQSRLAVIEH